MRMQKSMESCMPCMQMACRAETSNSQTATETAHYSGRHHISSQLCFLFFACTPANTPQPQLCILALGFARFSARSCWCFRCNCTCRCFCTLFNHAAIRLHDAQIISPSISSSSSTVGESKAQRVHMVGKAASPCCPCPPESAQALLLRGFPPARTAQSSCWASVCSSATLPISTSPGRP